MFGIPLNYWAAIALAIVGVGYASWDWWAPALAKLRLPTIWTAAKPSDDSDMAALKQLCRRYKADPEGSKAIHVLKERFLLVPGAFE